jgi:hypothetical protein
VTYLPRFRAALQRIAALHWPSAVAPWKPPIPGLRQVMQRYMATFKRL